MSENQSDTPSEEVQPVVVPVTQQVPSNYGELRGRKQFVDLNKAIAESTETPQGE